MAARHRRFTVIVTCEHGGNRVPRKYAQLFAPHRALLETHRGWDPGSLKMGRAFADAFAVPLIASTTTRLLVELNRSPHHRSLFSTITRPLPAEQREEILERWYWPHRQQVVDAVDHELARADAVIHLAMHTFTPVLDGKERTTDIGLLFDPARRLERAFCTRWQRLLRDARPDLTIHRNQPYRGVSDGLQTTLRRQWPESKYAGVELEVNQRFATGLAREWTGLIAVLTATCRSALESM